MLHKNPGQDSLAYVLRVSSVVWKLDKICFTVVLIPTVTELGANNTCGAVSPHKPPGSYWKPKELMGMKNRAFTPGVNMWSRLREFSGVSDEPGSAGACFCRFTVSSWICWRFFTVQLPGMLRTSAWSINKYTHYTILFTALPSVQYSKYLYMFVIVIQYSRK